MEKKFIYRKLRIENEDYYQIFASVDVDTVVEGIKDISEAGNSDYFYQIAEFPDDIDESIFLYKIFKYENGNLQFLNDAFAISNIRSLFWEHYQDFDLIPKNNFDVEKIKEAIKKEVKYQDKAIDELLNILKSNLDILDSNLSDKQKKKMIHNVILYGPSGFGKSSIIETLVDNTDVPCGIIELTADANKNLSKIVEGLTNAAVGNMKHAEHGIVFIRDNFDVFENLSDDLEINPFLFVEELLAQTQAVTRIGDEKAYFDLGKITYVLEKTTNTNDAEDLFEEGLTDSVYHSFQDVICVSSLTDEEMKDVILNDSKSVLNLYRDILEKIGKELVIEDGFVEHIIRKTAYDLGGLALIYNYIESMIKAQWNSKKIILTKELIDKEVMDFSGDEEYTMEEGELPDNDYDNIKRNAKRIYDKKSEGVKNVQNEDVKEFKIDLEEIRNRYRKILEWLMQYVKGQDEPLKSILYHVLINDVIQNSNLPLDRKKERIDHLLIRGGTGSGKSYITSLIANAMNKPYAVVDCKRYTETGYIGKSVDDMLIKLYYAAGCDLEKAQNGILILDEFDKLARKNDNQSDAGRGGVQESLLKLLEGTIFDLEIKNGMNVEIVNFDTRSLGVICAGAFEGLDKIRDERIGGNKKKKTMGFKDNNSVEKEEVVDKRFILEDMQNFGIDAQLLRRLSFHCDLNKLDKNSYKSIMLDSKSSSFLIKVERLEMLGVKVKWDDAFVDRFVEEASKLGFGASSIAVLTDRIFSAIESKIMLGNFEEVFLNEECVQDPEKVILIERKNKTLKKQNR